LPKQAFHSIKTGIPLMSVLAVSFSFPLLPSFHVGGKNRAA
jgi:hypothetical protein